MAQSAGKAATSFTKTANAKVLEQLAFDDVRDFEDARRGFVAPLADGGVIKNAKGDVVWDLSLFDYASAGTPCPDTVNPSLWRQTQLVREAGLFKVVDRLYQVRGHDLGQVTIVEGDDGLIIIDTGATSECAGAAMELFYANRPRLPVVAVIYTHTHADHYGGILGITTAEDVAAGKVAIIAPGDGFEQHALGENVICGNVMSRRGLAAFGGALPECATGFVSDGIALALSKNGTTGYLSPTDVVRETGEQRTIAGLTFMFQMTPDTEAPEEFHIYIPELKALTCAENANHSLHNIQTLRGARTRDAANFYRYLDEAIDLFGGTVEVHYGPHTWPVWGNENVVAFLESQRDTYKYIHDQALRLANHGYTPVEIAESIELPDVLRRAWWNRGYHGTLNHDLKAVYAKELGWYDGNPMHLFPHPPAENAQRYVEAIGGIDAVLAKARAAFEAGDYRWVVELAGQAVFADPAHTAARELQADAYEQLGFQAEGPQWRNIFLSAAADLRGEQGWSGLQTASLDTIMGMPVGILFDYLAVRLNGPEAVGANIGINLTLTDHDDVYSLKVANGVLHHWTRHLKNPDLTLTTTKKDLVGLLFQPEGLERAVAGGKASAEGDMSALTRLTALFDAFDPHFSLISSNAGRE